MRVTPHAHGEPASPSGDARPRGAPDSVISALIGARIPEQILSGVMAAELESLRGSPLEARRRAILLDRLDLPKKEAPTYAELAARLGVKPSVIATDQGELADRIRRKVRRALADAFPPPDVLLQSPGGTQLNALGGRMSSPLHPYSLNRERWNPHVTAAVTEVRRRLAAGEAMPVHVGGFQVSGDAMEQSWVLEHLWLAAHPASDDEVERQAGWAQAHAVAEWIERVVAEALAAEPRQAVPMASTPPRRDAPVTPPGDAQPRGAPDSLMAALVGGRVPERILSSVMAAELEALRGTPLEARRRAVLLDRLDLPKKDASSHAELATRLHAKPSQIATDQSVLADRIRWRVHAALAEAFPPPAELLRTRGEKELNMLGHRMSAPWHRYSWNRERWNPHIGTAIAAVRERLARGEAAFLRINGHEVEGSTALQLWVLDRYWLAAAAVGTDTLERRCGWLEAFAVERWISDHVEAAAAASAGAET